MATFTCYHCGGVFPQDPAQTEDERITERQRLFGAPQPDDVVVCDDCYRAVLNTLN